MAKTHLLLLDDHTLFRAMLSRLLDTERDFRVAVHCSSIQEALDALGRHPVDLVLLDYDLGNKQNGLQFIRAAREAGFITALHPRTLLRGHALRRGNAAAQRASGSSHIQYSPAPAVGSGDWRDVSRPHGAGSRLRRVHTGQATPHDRPNPAFAIPGTRRARL